MINEKERMIKEKLDFFMNEKVKVHIKRNDRIFWNGHIIKKISENIFLFNEIKKGEVYLFISDIFEIEEYQED